MQLIDVKSWKGLLTKHEFKENVDEEEPFYIYIFDRKLDYVHAASSITDFTHVSVYIKSSCLFESVLK